LPPHEGFNPDTQRVDNLEFETRQNIFVADVRKHKDSVNLDEHGFQVLAHTTKVPDFEHAEDVFTYKLETEQLLKDTLGACFVKTYHHVIRKNIAFQRTEFDINDPLHTEGVAQGAHNGKIVAAQAHLYAYDRRHNTDFRTRGHQTSFVN
jgi:hypothetical protein